MEEVYPQERKKKKYRKIYKRGGHNRTKNIKLKKKGEK